MGEALGGVGQALQSGISGYNQGKAQAMASRMQESARLLKMADEYATAASKYQDNPDQKHMYDINMKAWADAHDQADKLSGEKGRGAWKQMKGIFSHVLPGIVDDGKGAPQADGAQAPSPSVWQQMATNAPLSEKQLLEKRQSAGAEKLGAYLNKFKDLDEARNDPNFLTTIIAAQHAGIDALKMAEFLKTPGKLQITVPEGTSLEPYGIKPGQKLDAETYIKLTNEVPDEVKKLANHHAALHLLVANNTATPAQKAESDKLDKLLNPRNLTQIDIDTAGLDINTDAGRKAYSTRMLGDLEAKINLQRRLNPEDNFIYDKRRDARTGYLLIDKIDKRTGIGTVTAATDARTGRPISIDATDGSNAIFDQKWNPTLSVYAYVPNIDHIMDAVQMGRISSADAMLHYLPLVPDDVPAHKFLDDFLRNFNGADDRVPKTPGAGPTAPAGPSAAVAPQPATGPGFFGSIISNYQRAKANENSASRVMPNLRPSPTQRPAFLPNSGPPGQFTNGH